MQTIHRLGLNLYKAAMELQWLLYRGRPDHTGMRYDWIRRTSNPQPNKEIFEQCMMLLCSK